MTGSQPIKSMRKQDAKTLYYLSMEFLMGRALGNNIINLDAIMSEIKEALDELGFDLNVIEDQEPDAALRKRRSWPSGGLLPGFSGNSWLSGVWLRYPLSLWYVQAEDRGRLPGRGSGRVVKGRQSI